MFFPQGEKEGEGGRKSTRIVFHGCIVRETVFLGGCIHTYMCTRWLSFSMNVPSSLVVGPRATSFSRRALESAHCGTTSITWYRGTNCVKWKYMRALMRACTVCIRVKRNLDARSDGLCGTGCMALFFFLSFFSFSFFLSFSRNRSFATGLISYQTARYIERGLLCALAAHVFRRATRSLEI